MNDKSLFLPGIILLGCLLAATLTGCSPPLPKNEISSLEITSYKPIVHIYPVSADLSRAAIAVPPFQLPAHIETVRGQEVAALFQQTLLRERVFHTVKLIPDHYGTLDEALEIARGEKVDLVLAGRINYVIEGSSTGGGRLNLSLRIIETAGSETVWYIEQTVSQAMNYPDTSLLHRLSRIFSTPRTPDAGPAPALPLMLARSSRDIARIVKSGHSPDFLYGQ